MLYPDKKILIADDHVLTRKGLRLTLETQVSSHIFEADNGADALKIIEFERPDLAILDVEMPVITGYEVAENCAEKYKNMAIIFLTMYKDKSMINKALSIGIKGYVLKENTVIEILQCLKSVFDGNEYISPAMRKFVNANEVEQVNSSLFDENIKLLTTSEKKIIKMLSEMKTSSEIANELSISIKTVQNHRNNICVKLGLTGTHALLKFAIENISQIY